MVATQFEPVPCGATILYYTGVDLGKARSQRRQAKQSRGLAASHGTTKEGSAESLLSITMMDMGWLVTCCKQLGPENQQCVHALLVILVSPLSYILM